MAWHLDAHNNQSQTSGKALLAEQDMVALRSPLQQEGSPKKHKLRTKKTVFYRSLMQKKMETYRAPEAFSFPKQASASL